LFALTAATLQTERIDREVNHMSFDWGRIEALELMYRLVVEIARSPTGPKS